jgi:hypothetical protein
VSRYDKPLFYQRLDRIAGSVTKPEEQNSSQQGRKGHKGLILNSATSYPKCPVFAAFAALLWESSVLVSLAYLREDFLWLRLCRAVIFCKNLLVRGSSASGPDQNNLRNLWLFILLYDS